MTPRTVESIVRSSIIFQRDPCSGSASTSPSSHIRIVTLSRA